MKIKITSKKYNPLLKRREVVFEVDHNQEGQTSPRLELRKHLANLLKAKIELVFVEKEETKTGTMTAIGKANAYESLEQAKLVEPKHIMIRNTTPEKPAEPEETRPTREKRDKEERETTPTPAPKEVNEVEGKIEE